MKFKALIILTLSLILLALSPLMARSWNVVTIEKAPDVDLNSEVLLSIDLNRGGFEIGSFNMSIYFDPDALTLTNASFGSLFEACNWEYFNYIVEPCDGCDYDLIKIEAVAEYFDNGQTATCLAGPGEIVTLVFQTASDSVYSCTSTPVGFYWEDCFDNLFINTDQDTLWFSDYVTDFDGNDITGDPNFGGAPKTCLESIEEVPFRFLDYVTGGIIFDCGLGYFCGDVNGDDKISLLDPVFLVDYLFKSGAAPDPIERGDVDCSGDIPNMNDLQYLINYIFNGGPEPCCLGDE